MKITFIMIAFLLCLSLSGQVFEGMITYKVEVTPLIDNHVNNEYFKKRWGDKMIISHDKNGNQLRVCKNSVGIEYQLYINSENRFYAKYIGFDTIYHYSCADNMFALISLEKKEDKMILGHECTSLLKSEYFKEFKDTIKCKMYFSPKLKAPWQKYEQFADGNLNKVYGQTKSHMLYYNFKMREYLVEFDAIEIERKELNQDLFKLPPNAPLKNIDD